MDMRGTSSRVGVRARLGFTIYEVLIAGSIASIISAIAVANIARRLPSYRLERASWQLTGDLRAARMEAVTKSTRARITVDPSARTYTIWVDSDRDGVVDSGEQRRRSLANIPGIQVYCYPTTGTFLPQGTFESSYLYCYIAVWNNTAGYKYVYIFPSGQIDPYSAT
jgi:type II secretory pathway pseudopilin PulG